MSTKREEDLSKECIEVIDTGSTGRGTNEPGDGDFDFMVRVDKRQVSNLEELKKKIREELFATAEPDKAETTGKGDFRYKGVTIEGLDKKVDIDLTFTRRTDEIEYTTEECIKDRLETIKRNNPEDYKYVIANILLAKKVLKTEGVYKKKSSAEPEAGKEDTRGGLGAVGIENWILQNGGSFEKAAREFLKSAGIINETGKIEENASPISFRDFQQAYAVWDFGENYSALDKENYAHDNFVYNMNETGYSKMVRALRDYVKAIETEKKEQEQSESKKTIEEIVKQDPSALEATIYMISVADLLAKAQELGKGNFDNNISK